MFPLQHIDLLALQSRLKYDKDQKGMPMVFDPVRRKYIRTNPEELVRQLWILYFIEVMGINAKLIAAERAFTVFGTERRFDLVIFDKTTNPILLCEFKAPGVVITQSVFDQIAQYNMQLQVPYALVSNGSVHYCFQIDDERAAFVFQSDLPFKSLNP